MTLAQESDMAFAGAMTFSIDKEEFWQLSSDGPAAHSPSPVPEPSGSFSDESQFAQHDDAHPRFSSDSSFFDNYVKMEIEAPGGTLGEDQDHHSPGESFFIPSSPHNHYLGEEEGHGLELEGSGLSPPASASSVAEPISVTSAASSHHSHMDDDHHLSFDMMSVATSIPSMDGSTKSHTSLMSQRQTAPRQGQQMTRASGDSTNHVVLGHLDAETLEQRRRLLSGRRGLGQHQPAGGSISDSELLRLEGLSVNSPHGMAVGAGAARNVPSSSSSKTQLHRSMTPSTSTPTPHVTHGLPLATSKSNVNLRGRHAGGPPQPARSSDDIDLCNLTGSRRQNFKTAGTRKFESIYATIRRGFGGGQTPRGRLNSNQQNQPRTAAPLPQTLRTSHMESAKKATRRLASESRLMWDGLPVSPPLTDMSNNHMHGNHDNSAFVAGLMDDPFFDSSIPFGRSSNQHPGLAPAAEINGKSAAFNANIPHTPLHTPTTKTEMLGDDRANYFPTTNEAWGLNGTNFGTSSDLSSATSFLSSDRDILDAWSFNPSNDNGHNMDFTADGTHLAHRNHHNLTIQVPSYITSHQEQSSSDDMASSGLMIHMPQPRTPSTAPLLSSQIQQTHNGMPLHDASVAYPFPEGTPQHYLHQPLQPHQQQQYSASRRPKPRAPSSGARYLSNNGGASSISPRKMRQPSSSSESPSPTPNGGGGGGGRRSRSTARRQSSMSQLGGGGGGPQSALAHRKSTTDLLAGVLAPSSDTQSHAVKKRRSTSSWRGPVGSRRSVSGDSGICGGGGGGGISLDGMGGGGGGGPGIGFVNYTPSDHDVLMTGVAPSGSSKTKARREKEAEDKRRKLSEAMMRMASDAGVDVAMFKEEGIVI